MESCISSMIFSLRQLWLETGSYSPHLKMEELDLITLETHTVKILKFGTPQTIAIIVLKIIKFDVTLH